LSWDVVLQKFERGAEATFDLDAAKVLLRQTSGFRDIEPGICEVVGDGYAEIYYGAGPSSDIMVAVRAGSPALIELICKLAAALQMTVFFPTDSGWELAVLSASQAEDLPGRSWDGWEHFDEELTPPTAVVYEHTMKLASALRVSYDAWEDWARQGN
jgi:hypothetical protein